MAPHSVTLEFLQSLSDAGNKEELQSAMTCCGTKELRSFCGGMGVRVRSREYAAYHTKAGYTELLTQLLLAKSASKGLAVDSASLAIVVTPVERTRKTKNCNLRLLNVLFSEVMAPFLSGMNASPTQAEISAGAVGGNNPFWTKFHSEFISNKAEYSRLTFQDASLTGKDLSTPIPHSSAKLREMWSELWGAYNSALIRFSADPNLDFETCCPSRNDVLYMRHWLNVKPNLLSDICVKQSVIPQNVLIAPSVSTNEDVAALENAEARLQLQPGRKRPLMATNRVAKVPELTTSNASDSERTFLMQSIRHAAEILKLAREADLGSEVEDTVWCELQQCTKRLKRIQQQTQETDEAEEEEKH
ncbi:hypothetical protein PHMEG_00018785 [Phytophthora megakarya]|uniref:Uncharacterized protein n=1 Tax=Phytophthora megakarya TaxID=4795 RepID=A0A225VUI2_9STRA|nr:hypothetical protein PHMEG_00018785 [Phytophthora megakarya]